MANEYSCDGSIYIVDDIWSEIKSFVFMKPDDFIQKKTKDLIKYHKRRMYYINEWDNTLQNVFYPILHINNKARDLYWDLDECLPVMLLKGLSYKGYIFQPENIIQPNWSSSSAANKKRHQDNIMTMFINMDAIFKDLAIFLRYRLQDDIKIQLNYNKDEDVLNGFDFRQYNINPAYQAELEADEIRNQEYNMIRLYRLYSENFQDIII